MSTIQEIWHFWHFFFTQHTWDIFQTQYVYIASVGLGPCLYVCRRDQATSWNDLIKSSYLLLRGHLFMWQRCSKGVFWSQLCGKEGLWHCRLLGFAHQCHVRQNKWSTHLMKRTHWSWWTWSVSCRTSSTQGTSFIRITANTGCDHKISRHISSFLSA